MTTEKFWIGWLKVAAVVVTLFGVFMALFNHTNAFNFMTAFIEKAFYTDSEFALKVASLQNWLVGTLGATMAGWGLMMLYLIKHPIQNKEKWAWNAMLLSVIVWLTIDCLVSYHYKAYFNLVVNAIFYLQFFAPLMVIRKSMTN